MSFTDHRKAVLDDLDVCNAVLSKSVVGSPFSEKARNGAYLNSLTSYENPFVPVVSLFQLYGYGKVQPDPSDLRVAVAELVEKDWRYSFRGEPFELFHLHYERLRQAAIRTLAQKQSGSDVVKLANYYGKGRCSMIVMIFTRLQKPGLSINQLSK